MDSHGLDAFCLDASYIAAFNILNIPSLAIPDSSRHVSSNLSWLATSNITTYTAEPISITLNNFTYEEITSLPLAKPLTIQCPVPACIFPISGYFTFLQRLLLYINIFIATFALQVPLLRGVSQIWLTTFWCSVLGMFLATVITTKVPMIYNLDIQPALLVVHIGLLPTLLWFSFRAEPGAPRHSAENPEGRVHPVHLEHHAEDVEGAEHAEHAEEIAANESWSQRLKRQFREYPVTRILVPFYSLFGVGNIIMANATQDSAGFWPKATAVILSDGTNYLLTSPCFENPSGFFGLWPPSPSPYNGIRALNSLSIYYPPPGSSAVDALQAIPRTDLPVLHVGSVLICFVIFILSFIRLSSLENMLHEMFRTTRQSNPIIKYIAILLFTFPLFVAVGFTLYVIIIFEINAWGAALPENESYAEIGQWGPYVVGALVFIATLIARKRSWDFDTKDADSENRAFGWLLRQNGSRGGNGDERGKGLRGRDPSRERRASRDSSQDRLVQQSFLPGLDFTGNDEGFQLDLWRQNGRRSRRSSQAP